MFLPAGDTTSAVAGLAGELRTARPPLVRVLAFSEAEESSSPATVAAVGSALAESGYAGVPLVSGTNVYFNELNRHRIPPGRAAGLAWSVNPQIHAFDDLSLMENLQAQPATIATARFFAPAAALFVTPITLRPRFNAVAVTDAGLPDGALPEGALPEGALPWPADVRQPSLFGAAWTLGSIAALASAGADGLTYYDTVGPAGVIESPAGSPAPAEFFSRADTPYPLAVVLADAARLAGGRVCRVTGADPARVAAIAVRQPDRTTVLLANLTAGACEVGVALPGRRRWGAGHAADPGRAHRGAGRRRPAVLPAHRPAGDQYRRDRDADPESIRHRAAGGSRWLTGGRPGSWPATGCSRCTATTRAPRRTRCRPPR